MPITQTVHYNKDYRGDPRQVLALSKMVNNLPKEEWLWGCDNSEESIRMSDIIVNGGFLAIKLNESGVEDFRCLEKEQRVSGTRFPYFIDRFEMGGFTKAPRLLGHFVFELVNNLRLALSDKETAGNRPYFRKNGKQDYRVVSYDFLSKEEVSYVEVGFDQLIKKCPQHRRVIERMIETLKK
jgi:hypothetical protein